MCVPYRSSLRFNSMVHDVSHGVQIEAFIYSRLKGREICPRSLLSPPPQEPINSGARHGNILFENFASEVPITTLISIFKESVCFALYELVSYSGSFTLTSSR